MADTPAKPVSKPLNILRWSWGVFLILLFAFSILMAAWGDLREALMLKVLDDRYNKSFIIQAPHEAKVWLGDEYLGISEPHPLAVNEPEDSPTEVEGMSVLLPRVYFYEVPLLETATEFEVGESTTDLLKKLLPHSEPLWTEAANMPEIGWVPALLKTEDGRFDFVNIGRADWPTREGGTQRYAFLIRVVLNESPAFVLERTEIWSDQLYADEGGFWSRRDQWDGFPPHLAGQSKTVWRWFIATRDVAWLSQRSGVDMTDAEWFRLPETD
ncbi:MAG: hypothetical protein K8I27_04045 [Planctomycetes bacterium]|nr:hypothetical protein [Planctomycetota bacterium]